MGFLDKFLGTTSAKFDPQDLLLPEEIQTNVPGKTLIKSSYTQPVEIEIVGESFRAKNINMVSLAAQGAEFDIYLLPEPTNPHDKRAVAVYVGNLHVGYIAKPGNAQWFKWATESLEENICLWGRAKAISKSGTSNTGIFGFINMPEVGKDVSDVLPVKLNEKDLKKLHEKIKKLANSIEEPETIAQLKSSAKKAASEAKEVAAHALAIMPEIPETDAMYKSWESILDVCGEILETAKESFYATNVEDFDITTAVYDLAELLNEVVTQ